jgi:asparagine synthase (glutamine-hydrolysing)
MCGIFGFWAANPDAGFDGELLQRGAGMLAHRGPDGSGVVGWTPEGQRLSAECLGRRPLRVGLGHRRLAIFDLSDAGLQPMEGEGGPWISYNGEIYNYRDLRAELEGLGHRFHTATDTEVILAAYRQWGERCVERFNGMWAFLLYDPARERLLASRDRLGVKPLYYVRTDDGMAFASEVAPLLGCPGVQAIIVPERLAAYLLERRIDDTEGTIYRDIAELRGGHCLRLDTRTGAVSSWRYWQLPDEGDLELSDEAALDQFSELIEDAVCLRLHADVPVAITLSGGIDSSVLTVAAGRLARGVVRTFSSRFPGRADIDESAFAAQVAAASGAAATYVEPSTANVVDDEPMLTRHQAMPYSTLSLYVHWAILASIRQQGVPIVISGQGGDENFFGYERFYATAVRESLPNPIRAGAIAWEGSRNSRLTLPRMLATIGYFSLPGAARLLRRRRLTGTVRPEWLDSPAPAVAPVVGSRRRQQMLELRALSLPSLLRYDDRTAGALGMETRLPFLDYRVVEFAFRLPTRHKIRHGWTKFLLRRYLDRHGLPDIAWRKAKVAFEAPQDEWTRALVKARGTRLTQSAQGQAFLVPGTSLDRVSAKTAWDLYNCLHLAELLDWNLEDAAA